MDGDGLCCCSEFAESFPHVIAEREINAVIELRMSPFGENVTIYVSKVATTEAV